MEPGGKVPEGKTGVPGGETEPGVPEGETHPRTDVVTESNTETE